MSLKPELVPPIPEETKRVAKAAAAISITRIDDWLTGTPLAKTRISRFQALQSKAA